MAARKTAAKPAATTGRTRSLPSTISAGDGAAAAPRIVAHLTLAERVARGRAARTD